LTKLQEIMELLKDRELTSLDIAFVIGIPKSNCALYLNTLYNDGRIDLEIEFPIIINLILYLNYYLY